MLRHDGFTQAHGSKNPTIRQAVAGSLTHMSISRDQECWSIAQQKVEF
jgi:hypothetical protein